MARIARILNVLIVEDSENDATLLLEELKQKGYTPLHERVQTPAAMTLALERHLWDVVISDYVMPQFSGPDALRLLRESKLDIPFIVVSGTYGEETAVDMMKAGANDYITKANLSRLTPAIEREMEAAKSRAARAGGSLQAVSRCDCRVQRRRHLRKKSRQHNHQLECRRRAHLRVFRR